MPILLFILMALALAMVPTVIMEPRPDVWRKQNNTRVVLLDKPLKVRDTIINSDLNIPAGEKVNYRNRQDKIIIWNHEYHNDDKHQYEVVPSRTVIDKFLRAEKSKIYK